mmetsp:Transcript_6803/g.5953  ORF Transcript_6803/g.5953 Transcript_6803/m.5953 type:complete len:223 (+) Transcript_6803:31-699(+)
MVKFWGNVASQPSRSVEYVLKKFGVEYEYKHTEFVTETRTEDFKSNINSRGQVPVIDVDGQKIVESSAILRYLLDTYDTEELLFPKSDLVARAQADAWFDVSGTVYRPTFTSAYRPLVFAPVVYGAPKPSEEETKSLLEGVHNSLKDFNENLGNSKFVTGEKLSIVDVVLFNEVLSVCHLLKIDTSEYEKLHAWRDAVKEDEIVADLEKQFIDVVAAIMEKV